MLLAARTRRRFLTVAALAAVCVVWAGSSDTMSAWTSGTVNAQGNSVGSGTLAVSHSYGSTCAASLVATPTVTACSASIMPASSTNAGPSRTDTITNTGTTSTAGTASTYQVAACGPVSLDDTGSQQALDDLLLRSGTTVAPTSGPFAGAGSVSFDGTGYASSANSRTEPTASTTANTTLRYGYGIWFKTAGTNTNSPLFGLSASANNTDTTGDRVLYLNNLGQIVWVSNGITTASGTGGFDNNAWHFAYVVLSPTRSASGLSVSTRVTVTVDGTAVINNQVSSIAATTGFWHVGWAPVLGNATRYLTGSLSGFTIDTTGSATAPSGVPTSYTAGTELWRMDDSGGAYDGTTASGYYPGTSPFGAADPCAAITVAWPQLSYSGTLRGLVAAGTRSATFPAPAATVSGTITLTSSATAVLKNLLIYAPIRADYKVGTNWTLALTWGTSATAVVLG